jgi:hypothetical protein
MRSPRPAAIAPCWHELTKLTCNVPRRRVATPSWVSCKNYNTHEPWKVVPTCKNTKKYWVHELVQIAHYPLKKDASVWIKMQQLVCASACESECFTLLCCCATPACEADWFSVVSSLWLCNFFLQHTELCIIILKKKVGVIKWLYNCRND